MAQNIVGFFENVSTAQVALQELVEAGIPRHNIVISSPQLGDGVNTNAMYPVEGDADPVGIGSLINSLVADEEVANMHQRPLTTNALPNQRSVLRVVTPQPDDVKWIANRLHKLGASAVYERDQSTLKPLNE